MHASIISMDRGLLVDLHQGVNKLSIIAYLQEMDEKQYNISFLVITSS